MSKKNKTPSASEREAEQIRNHHSMTTNAAKPDPTRKLSDSELQAKAILASTNQWKGK